MPDRLSALDVSFLYMEEPSTAMHVGGVAVFRTPPGGFDVERLVGLLRERIAYVPRYRQRVRTVPGRLANPVWVDDEDFDITAHVRRSGLPRPGSDAQLRDLVARVMGWPLDRRRPLWEIYLVEGLSDDRFAVITKTHHAMVDGIGAVDISSVLLDPTPQPRPTPADSWRPTPEPSSLELVAGALAEVLERPGAALDAVRGALGDLQTTATRVAGTASGLAATLGAIARPAPASPLNTTVGEQRRFGTADTDLADYKRVRRAHGGTVNDVLLATVAGGLRHWLEVRGEPPAPGSVLRAMVPVSVRRAAPGSDGGQLGNQIASCFVDLPVGEPDPVRRLAEVNRRMTAVKDAYQAVGARALVAGAGFAPPTVHAIAARTASRISRRLFNLVVTNVPGPQLPLYAAGARMLHAYPVVPLARGQAVAVGATSYDGAVYYGLNADRDALRDVDVLAAALPEALAELVATS